MAKGTGKQSGGPGAGRAGRTRAGGAEAKTGGGASASSTTSTMSGYEARQALLGVFDPASSRTVSPDTAREAVEVLRQKDPESLAMFEKRRPTDKQLAATDKRLDNVEKQLNQRDALRKMADAAGDTPKGRDARARMFDKEDAINNALAMTRPAAAYHNVFSASGKSSPELKAVADKHERLQKRV